MKKLLSLFTIAAFTFSSCSNTQLISSWKSPGTPDQSYGKILVVGMTGSKDRELRESIENSLASKMQARGINAITSTEQFGPKSFRTMSEDEAVKMVNDNGFDAVMVVAMLDRNQEQHYTPGYVTSQPYAVVRNRWYGNYTVLYDRVYNPGYYTTTTDYTLEADFYRTSGDQLIYSAQAKSFDPNSPGELAGDFAKTVVKDMVDKGIFSKNVIRS